MTTENQNQDKWIGIKDAMEIIKISDQSIYDAGRKGKIVMRTDPITNRVEFNEASARLYAKERSSAVPGKDWEKMGQATKRMGITDSSIARYVKSGDLRTKEASGGRYYSIVDMKAIMASGRMYTRRKGKKNPSLIGKKTAKASSSSAAEPVASSRDEGLRSRIAAISPGSSFFTGLTEMVDRGHLTAKILLQIFGEEIQKLLP